MSGKPSVAAELTWQGDLRFQARSGEAELLLDSDGRAGASPVQALVIALAGCMGMDVALILTRSRLPLQALHARISGERAAEDPRRLLSVRMQFVVEGDVPAERVERAVQLSREKYCSVWHSMRPDIELTTSVEVRAPGAPAPDPPAGQPAP
jgi:putative redox protein